MVVGSGDVVSAQLPAYGSYIEKANGKIYLYTDKSLMEENVTVPNFTGMTAAQANAMLTGLGLNIKIEGTKNYLTGTGAVVFSQSIPAGTKVAKGEVVILTFRHMTTDD